MLLLCGSCALLSVHPRMYNTYRQGQCDSSAHEDLGHQLLGGLLTKWSSTLQTQQHHTQTSQLHSSQPVSHGLFIHLCSLLGPNHNSAATWMTLADQGHPGLVVCPSLRVIWLPSWLAGWLRGP